MSDKRDSSQGPIRPGVNQQDPKSYNEVPNQKEERAWEQRQQNDPMKQQSERDWEQAQREKRKEEDK